MALDTEVLVSMVVVACGKKKVLQTILLIFFYGGGCGVGIVGIVVETHSSVYLRPNLNISCLKSKYVKSGKNISFVHNSFLLLYFIVKFAYILYGSTAPYYYYSHSIEIFTTWLK